MTEVRRAYPTGSKQDPCVPAGCCACPIDTAFSAFGKKWSLMIVRNILHGDAHFNQILGNIDGLNPKTLSARLKELEAEGLIRKEIVSTSPVQIEYRLTEKGHAILPVLRSMAEWSFRWAPERVFANGRTPADLDEFVQRWESSLVASSR